MQYLIRNSAKLIRCTYVYKKKSRNGQICHNGRNSPSARSVSFTVSRALKDNPRISEATRKRVRKVADDLGYHPNSIGKQMRQGRSRIIGVIVPDLSIHFFPKIIEGIQSTLEKHGYSILLFNTEEKLGREEKAVKSCLGHRVDGVLAAISMQTKSFSHYEELLKCQIPVVFFDRVANFLPVPKVVTTDHQAAYDATSYLIDSGCKRILTYYRQY